MVRNETWRLDVWTLIWLGSAAFWSLGLVAAGFFVDSYSTSNSAGFSSPQLTLVQENGLKVVLPLFIPFVTVVIVALALRRRRRAHRRGVGALVWTVFGLLGLLVPLGAFTIGPFIFPVAFFLLMAIIQVRDHSPSFEPGAR
jgi:4-amino-4-deoxy-L-arabinose transferase-like glycosyltransferase